jgi:hypothetical protein
MAVQKCSLLLKSLQVLARLGRFGAPFVGTDRRAAWALLHQFQDAVCEMFQLVIAVYGYVMATGIDCFILLFVVLFKSLVNSENKLLPVK